MTKYLASLTRTVQYEVEVEATSTDEAHFRAIEAVNSYLRAQTEGVTESGADLTFDHGPIPATDL